jgi:pimeloyl-ACP methyl ester carboxylesterase
MSKPIQTPLLLLSLKNRRVIELYFSIIFLSLLLPLCSHAQHTYGSFYSGDAFVTFVLAENKSESAPIIMIPGANLSTYLYVTTPDGRKGWADLFADRGYDVYMVNDPRYDFATGGFVAPFTVPADGKAATPGSEQGWQRDIWMRWGFGPAEGDPYPDALFPTDSFDNFAENYPYLGESDQSYADAIMSVIDSVEGKVWLMAHSAGASRAVSVSKENAERVNGLILIEPAGPPDADDFPDLNGLHMFGVYGDYIISRNQTNRKLATEEAAELFKNAGGIADVVSLPEDSLVNGNSHILMQDRNSHEVFDIIELWLRQFSTGTVSSRSNQDIEILTYPNPAKDIVWVDGHDLETNDYMIYSSSGSLMKASKINGNQIDISDIPRGVFFLHIKSGDRPIIKKILKN